MWSLSRLNEGASYLMKAGLGFVGDAISIPTAISALVPALNGKYFGLSPWAIVGGVVVSAGTSLSSYKVDLALRESSRGNRSESEPAAAFDASNNTLINRLLCIGHFTDEVGELLTIATLVISLGYKPENSDVIDPTEAILYAVSFVISLYTAHSAIPTARDAFRMTQFLPSLPTFFNRRVASNESNPLLQALSQQPSRFEP